MEKYFLVVCLNPTLQRTVTLPRFEPGMRMEATSSRIDIAGKGVNPTRVIQQLGETAYHLTHLGGSHVELFLRLVADDRLNVAWVQSESEIRHCHTVVSEADHSTTELVEPGYPVDPSVEREVLHQYRVMVRDAHTVIIAGSKAPGYSDELYPTMVAEARALGVRTIVDYRGNDLLNSLDAGIDILKINVSEFSKTFLPEEPQNEEIPAAELPPKFWERLQRVRQEHRLRIVLTNGKEKILVADADDLQQVDPIPVTPVNTIGCGDAVTAGMAVGLHRGASLLDAVGLGAQCAAKNAGLLRPGRIK